MKLTERKSRKNQERVVATWLLNWTRQNLGSFFPMPLPMRSVGEIFFFVGERFLWLVCFIINPLFLGSAKMNFDPCKQ